MYGSIGKVETQYRAVGVTAEPDFDFVTVQNHAVAMEERETTGLIMIDVRLLLKGVKILAAFFQKEMTGSQVMPWYLDPFQNRDCC